MPAHVGVAGNESANTAAQNAARLVRNVSPQPGQPLIPLATSKAFIRRAFQEARQRRWLSTVASKHGLEHLSRLRVDIAQSIAFLVGRKQQQRTLARLRFGTCELNASRSYRDGRVTDQCECGQTETVKHFLLQCPRYGRQREYMLTKVRKIWREAITEEVLLGGSGVYMTQDSWQTVADAVTEYVRDTKREI